MSETQTPPDPEEQPQPPEADPTEVEPDEADADPDAPEVEPDELAGRQADKKVPEDEGDAGEEGAKT